MMALVIVGLVVGYLLFGVFVGIPLWAVFIAALDGPGARWREAVQQVYDSCAFSAYCALTWPVTIPVLMVCALWFVPGRLLVCPVVHLARRLWT